MNKEPKRRCRKCDRTLPATRYYKCTRCEPVLPEDVGDWLYAFELPDQLKALETYENVEREKTS